MQEKKINAIKSEINWTFQFFTVNEQNMLLGSRKVWTFIQIPLNTYPLKKKEVRIFITADKFNYLCAICSKIASCSYFLFYY